MNVKDAEKKYIVISCGGTGGHIVPGIALGAELKKISDVNIIYLINDKKVSGFFLNEMASCIILPEIKFSRFLSLRLFSNISGMIKITYRLLKLYFCHNVKIVVSAGGGAGVLPVLFSKCFNIKAVLLEQNVIMGKANKFLLNFVDRAYLSFKCVNIRMSEKILVKGNPIKESLFARTTKEESLQKLGLKGSRFTLLFFGGSQGARRINEFALMIVPLLKTVRSDIQVIHLTGNTMTEEAKALYKKLEIDAYCAEFSDDMLSIYSASDFVFARAGGGAVFEILFFNIPAVFVPFPYAAEKHQHRNAEYIQQNQCGYMIDENELFTEKAKEKIINLINNNIELKKMKNTQKSFARPHSGREIAEDVSELMRAS